MDDTELRGPRGAPGTGVRLAVRTGVTAVTASAFAGEVALAVAFATEHDVVGRQIEVTEAQGLIDDAWAWVIDICERTIGVWGTIGSARITAARITAARFSAARISAASRIRIWAAWIRIIFARIRLRLAARIRRVDVTAAGHKVVVLTSPIARAELIRIAAGHGLHLVVVPTVPIARALLIPRGVKVTAAGHKVVVRTVPIARAEWIRKRVVAIAAGLKVVVRTVPIARAVPIRRGVKVTAAGLKVVVRTAPIARAEWIRKRVEFAAGLKVVVRTVPIDMGSSDPKGCQSYCSRPQGRSSHSPDCTGRMDSKGCYCSRPQGRSSDCPDCTFHRTGNSWDYPGLDSGPDRSRSQNRRSRSSDCMDPRLSREITQP